MGTSKSGTGPASGVPLVPPWVPDPAPPGDDDNGADADGQDEENQPASAPNPPLNAPRARFGPARTSLGSFARNGTSNEMRRGLGHYVQKGLGGARTAVRRMEGTARTAGTLFGALSGTTAGQSATPGSPFDPALLAGRPVEEVMDALVEAVRPVDGTQDAEASRRAIRDAVAELLERFPEADLLNLSENHCGFVIERYVALDVFNRFALDLGKTVHDKAPSLSAALSRLKDIKDYIKETVWARFRALRRVSEQLSTRRVIDMVRQALRETFEVFEEYVQ